MSQQWLFKDREQATREFYKKEKAWTTGILVLINHIVYHFEDKKEWASQQAELLKDNYDNYAWTSLSSWHEWLRERDKNILI